MKDTKPKIIENGVSVLNVFMTHENTPCAGIALVTDDDQTIIITPYLELLLEIRTAIDNAINVLDPDYLKKEINNIKANGIKEAVSNTINMVLQHRDVSERELIWQLYRDEILSYADVLKNNSRS